MTFIRSLGLRDVVLMNVVAVVGMRWITQVQRIMRLAPTGDRWIADEARIGEVLAAIA